MSFQFVHLETYSRKSDKSGRSVNFIFDEADRVSHACVHVKDPEPPVLVYGQPIADLRSQHDEITSVAKMINKDGQERSLRKDQNTLLTVIASHPFTPEECKEDSGKMAEYEKWERDTVQWLQKQYGDELKTIVRHTDESRMHIHAYVLPENLKAYDLHPGVSSKRRVKAEALESGEDGKTANKMGDAAYKQSMRDWQDSYFDDVGVKNGLARLGPQLRRLSRAEWQREQKQAEALKVAHDRAADLNDKAQHFVENVKKTAGAISSDAARKKQAADAQMNKAASVVEQARHSVVKSRQLNQKAQNELKKAEKMISKARFEAQTILSSAGEKAKMLSGIGGFFRNIWDGLRRSAIRDEISKEYEKQVFDLEVKTSIAQSEIVHLRKDKRKFQDENQNLKNSVRELAADINKLHERYGNKKKNDYQSERKMRM